jgi:hypothetical protein
MAVVAHFDGEPCTDSWLAFRAVPGDDLHDSLGIVLIDIVDGRLALAFLAQCYQPSPTSGGIPGEHTHSLTERSM